MHRFSSSRATKARRVWKCISICHCKRRARLSGSGSFSRYLMWVPRKGMNASTVRQTGFLNADCVCGPSRGVGRERRSAWWPASSVGAGCLESMSCDTPPTFWHSSTYIVAIHTALEPNPTNAPRPLRVPTRKCLPQSDGTTHSQVEDSLDHL